MARRTKAWNALCALVILLGATLGTSKTVTADGGTGRQAKILVSYTESEWWLIRYADNQPLCQVFTDHEGWPRADEIYSACDVTVYNLWKTTPACPQLESNTIDTSTCPGLYLLLIGSQPAEKTIIVDLPPIQVWVNLAGCTPASPGNLCTEIPSLSLVGEEPLPNETLTTIHVILDGQQFECTGATCDIPLSVTPLEGVLAEFWADSSYGDSSQHFTAQVRVIDSGVSESPVGAGFYVDVLSTQWRGAPIASCAQTWQAFPPVGGPPAWLSTPELPELMASDEPFYYLAGRLITHGQVDAEGCPGGGLLANGYANACGLDLARPLVQEWQNRFDARIVEVAKETSVPAQLMKNLFAQESQFWPGAFKDPKEFGLGQLTDNGAETILLWNPTFYNQFCPLILDKDVCASGYTYLGADNQALLRGALAVQAKADCPDCMTGIDLANVDFSVSLFAQTLLANCEQVGQIMYNGTQQMAGTVSSYEDLWRFTLANYHAGPGCLSYAVYSAWSRRDPMDWAHVTAYLTPPCQGVISYVEKITR